MVRRRRNGRPWTYYSKRYADIPDRLYFVHHSGSQSWEEYDGTFRAAGACTTSRRGLVHLQQQICDHVDWYYPGATCFISTFSDYNHARNWAMQRRGTVTIYTINTCCVEEDCPPIFHAPDFTDNCWSTSEYLFLDRIPGDAIIHSETYVD